MPTSDTRPKTIIITSAVPYEGKSTATNLAETLAHAGCRVLLIDGDLPGPTTKILSAPSEPGSATCCWAS
jgi:Mrp family chromosome partitioning ATPase